MDFVLDAYQGPLDLLLRLIQRDEIDIYDIPIAKLTNQYIQEIAKLPPDMGQLSEFLVLAATLLEIKSRMLLPRPKVEAEYVDPRDALVERLLAYKQAQVIAQELDSRQPIGQRLIGWGDTPLLQSIAQETARTLPVNMASLQQLSNVFLSAIARKEDRRDNVRASYGSVPRERFTVAEKIATLYTCLATYGRASLRTLFEACSSKNEMVVTFLAVLEIIRQGKATAKQVAAFGDVEVLPCT